MKKPTAKIIYLLQYESNRIIYISPNVHQILGLSPAKFYMDGFAVFKSITHEEEEFVLYPTAMSMSSGSSGLYSSELLLLCKDRKFHSFEHHAIVLEEDTQDKPHVLVGSLTQLDQDKSGHNGCSTYLKIKNEWTQGPPYGIASLTFSKNVIKKMPVEHLDTNKKLQLIFDDDPNTLLSSRQKQVVKYLAKGYSAKCIAGKMAISENTVIDHKKKLLLLFNAKNTVEMIAKASKLFWI